MKNNRKEERLRREFLPEALEIVEKPASPLGHFGIIIICSTILILLLWACIGKIDVTVTARGKLAAGGEQGLQTVQAENGGRIKKICVKEGQQVESGDVLLELEADLQKEANSYTEETAEKATYKKTLIIWLQSGKSLAKLKKEKRIPEYEEVFGYLKAVEDEHLEQSQSLSKQCADNEEIIDEISDEISRLEEEEKNYRELYQAGAVTKVEWQEKKEKLSQQRLQLREVQQQGKQYKRSMETLEREYKKELAAMLMECEKEIEESEVSVQQSQESYESQFLKAPVSGMVKTVLVKTEGGILTPAQEVVQIIPNDERFVMELTVRNQDIGYVKQGQEVNVKLDTYNYQEYGKLKGTVIYISPDSFSSETLGEVYVVRVRLQEEEMSEYYRNLDWQSGIQGTAEIKAGERRIVNFFIEPVRNHIDGSLHTP